MLENKLGITDSTELARQEEKLSKKKAIEMFESGFLNTLDAGTFESLSKINKFLFEDIYDFAGEIRKVNISKGNFRFATIMYLSDALKNIENMPQSKFNQINIYILYKIFLLLQLIIFVSVTAIFIYTNN